MINNITIEHSIKGKDKVYNATLNVIDITYKYFYLRFLLLWAFQSLLLVQIDGLHYNKFVFHI